jgi:hypothetical protein
MRSGDLLGAVVIGLLTIAIVLCIHPHKALTKRRASNMTQRDDEDQRDRTRSDDDDDDGQNRRSDA